MRAIEESVMYPLPQRLRWGISMSNECCNSPVWQSWYACLRIALFAILLVYYIFGMPILFWWVRRKSAMASKILKEYLYLVAVFLTALYLLLAIIAEGLLNCQKLSSLDYVKIWAAANVFRYLANAIILYIIILPLADRMMKHASWASHPLLGHWLLMSFVSIFMLLFVVMWNYNLIHGVTGDDTTDSKYGVEATYVTLYLVAAFYASGHLFAARFRSLKNKASQKGLLPWCPLLAISLEGYAFRDFLVIFAFYVVSREYTEAASTTFLVLGLVFQAVMYLSLPLLASAKALEDAPAERLTEEHEPK